MYALQMRAFFEWLSKGDEKISPLPEEVISFYGENSAVHCQTSENIL